MPKNGNLLGCCIDCGGFVLSGNGEKINFAISGAGRIGRAVFRAYFENPSRYSNCRLVAMNDPHDFDTLAHLLRYDSVHGRVPFDLVLDKDEKCLTVGDTVVALLSSRDPKSLPWGQHGVDCVMECTGQFKDQAGLSQHLTAGASKVLLSAPAKGQIDATIVLGVNESDLRSDHRTVSIGSCTTNALAPVLKVVKEVAPIANCFFTTVHAYTKDQALVDSHHHDLRRARAASQSIIPTKTGAAKSIGLVLPDLSGKVEGYALRVPTANVSLIDVVIHFSENVTQSQLESRLRQAAQQSDYLDVTDEPLVSSDFNHNPFSAVIDMSQIQVNGKTARVVAWYDNEWAYALRMLDMANQLAKISSGAKREFAAEQ